MALQYNFLTGQYEDNGSGDTADYNTFDLSGAYTGTPGYVLPDVSNAAPDESPSTPAGNGTGYYQQQIGSSWTDLAKSALQYALGQETAKNAQATQFTQAQQMAAVQSQAAAVKARQNMFMFLLVAGVVIFVVVEEKK